MTARRPNCCCATDGTRWKRCFSMWRAAAPMSARPPNERAARRAPRPRARPFAPAVTLLATDRRNDRALLVSVTLIVAAAPGIDLLAGGADADVGLSAALHRSERRLLRPRRRHLHRRRAAVGYPVPRPARLLGLVPRGDVVAQPRQPDDEPAQADRVRHRPDGDEHRAASDRHGAGVAARDRLLRLQPLWVG